MSFDLDIVTQDVDGNRVVHEVVCGHTYNLMPMWYKALPSLGRSRDLGGRKCSELLPELRDGLDDILRNFDDYKALNPENGWGDVDGFFEIFVRFICLCASHPSGVVEWDG